MTPNGYPDESELRRIRKWHGDWTDLLAFVETLWRYADTGYWVQHGNRYEVSTVGWSGNESIIAALEENLIFWTMCWWSSRRGGHYEFKVPTYAVTKKSVLRKKEAK